MDGPRGDLHGDWHHFMAHCPTDQRRNVTLVHGGAVGLDSLADCAARTLGLSVEPHRAINFRTPRHRNQHMVNLGADVCLAFAQKWASGTGMCARMARKAGIPVVDYGVSTA